MSRCVDALVVGHLHRAEPVGTSVLAASLGRRAGPHRLTPHGARVLAHRDEGGFRWAVFGEQGRNMSSLVRTLRLSSNAKSVARRNTRSRSAPWVRPGTRLASRFRPFGSGCRALAATSSGSRSCVVTPASSRTRWAVVPRPASRMARRSVTDVAGCSAASAVLHPRHRCRSSATDTPPTSIGDLNFIAPSRESKTAEPSSQQSFSPGPWGHRCTQGAGPYTPRSVDLAPCRSVLTIRRARRARFGQSVRASRQLPAFFDCLSRSQFILSAGATALFARESGIGASGRERCQDGSMADRSRPHRGGGSPVELVGALAGSLLGAVVARSSSLVTA
jgi:hypothetical protein